MMCKVLIVDDELPDLEGLKRLFPWGELGLDLVAAVNGARKALACLIDQHVDILVTDIKMPRMSGLELAEQAILLQPTLKVIFVSSYADFHYAKQAVHLKAFGYVLKPVDDRELIQLLQRAKQELEREQLELAQAGMNASILQTSALKEWLDGIITTEEALPQLNSLPLALSGLACSAAVAELDDIGGTAILAEERSERIRTVIQLLETKYNVQKRWVLYKSADSRFVIIMNGPAETVKSELHALIEEIPAIIQCTMTIGCGDSVAQLADLPHSYRQAHTALDAKMFVGKNRLITTADTQQGVVKDVIDLEAQFDLLFRATSEYSLVVIYDTLERIFQLVRTSRNKVSVYNFAYFIFSKLENYLKQMKEDAQGLLGSNYEVLNQVLELETIRDIEQWMRKLFFQISEQLNKKRYSIGQKLVSEIEAYVHRNISSKITLKDLGEYLSFSGNYLGHLYKNVTGMTFGDYLIAARMEKAKELLDEPRLRVFEIAERVGYRDLPYFTKQFKEYYQVTPSEYRKKAK